MNLRENAVFHSIALAGLIGNIYGSLPIHGVSVFEETLLLVVLISNPILFGIMAWRGWQRRDLMLLFGWPALIIISWRLAFAIGARYSWGILKFLFEGDGFWRFLLRMPVWPELALAGICAVGYAIGATVASRRSAKERPHANASGL